MTRIKICGLSRPCDIEAVNQAMPDYIGFVFAKSRRQVSFIQAAQLKSQLVGGITAVGVFVDAPIEDILILLGEDVIDIAQLHGNEDEEYIKTLKRHSGRAVIKAVRMDSPHAPARWDDSEADFLLLDRGAGGTGKCFDHHMIGEIEKPFFLAGGLTLENVRQAADAIQPYAVDLSSGAETDGLKDPVKIFDIVKRIRNE